MGSTETSYAAVTPSQSFIFQPSTVNNDITKFKTPPEHLNFIQSPAEHPPPGTNVMSRWSYPPTQGDWAKIRPVLTQLYKHEQKPLKEVVEVLKQSCGFKATEQMCKKRIAKWGLERNLNQAVVDQVLGILAERREYRKDTKFILRGDQLDLNTVYKYMRKKKMSMSEAVTRYKMGQSKPCPDLKVLSPKSSSRSLIDVVHSDSYECCLYEYKSMIYGCLRTGELWEGKGGLMVEYSSIDYEISEFLAAFGPNDLREAMREGNIIPLRRLALVLERAVDSLNFWSFSNLLLLVLNLTLFEDTANVGWQLITLFGDMVKVKIKAGLPQFAFLHSLTTIDQERFPYILLALKEILSAIERELRPGSVKFCIWTQTSLICDYHQLGMGEKTSEYEYLVTQAYEELGPMSKYLHYLLCTGLFFTDLRDSVTQVVAKVVQHVKSQKLELCAAKERVKIGTTVLAEDSICNLIDILEDLGDLKWAKNLGSKLLQCKTAYKLSMDTEHWLLERVIQLSSKLNAADGIAQWRERMREIEDIWAEEVEAAVPSDETHEAIAIAD